MRVAIIINLLIIGLIVVGLFWFVRSSSPGSPALDLKEQVSNYF